MLSGHISGEFNAQASDGGIATVNASITKVYQNAPAAAVDAVELEAGRHALASIPVDALPALGVLPNCSRLPHLPNHQFVGRVGELLAMARMLRDNGAAIVGQSPLVAGIGGLGKTQLASQFCYLFGRYFTGGVFWLSFEKAESIQSEIAACGAQLNLHPEFGSLPLETQVGAVASRWQDGLPRLLVFDNCEDPGLYETFCPRAGACRVLITSRRKDWPGHLGIAPVDLGVLSPGHAMELLLRHRPDLAPDDADLAAICEELGYLPLALHLAGSYLQRYGAEPIGQPAVYLAAIRAPNLLDHVSMTHGGQSPTRHEQHVARTFALSHDRLKTGLAVDGHALSILDHAAHFAPGEAIPRPLLKQCVRMEGADEAGQRHFADGLTRLGELGLIDVTPQGVSLHRLVRAFVQQAQQGAVSARNSVEAALGLAAYEANETGLPANLLPWQTHLRFVADTAEKQGSEHAGTLLSNLGFHLNMIVDLTGARQAYERALQIAETAYGPDHPTVAIRVNNLGVVLRAEGDFAGAKQAFERALSIDEKAYGPDHPKVAIRLNNLGRVLKDQGDPVGAKQASNRALHIDEKAYGRDHPNVAIRVNNLGGILREEGDLAGARQAYERALHIDETAYGPDHPTVAICVNNLGLVLRAEGDLAGARQAYERALRIFETCYGPDHSNVATAVNNLGGVLHAEGDLAGARQAYERALRIFETCYGPDHPDVAMCRRNLGAVPPK